MRKKRCRPAVVWDLFRPQPQQPVWTNLPVEVRQKATRLLASLLLAAQDAKQATRRQGAAVGKEVGDE